MSNGKRNGRVNMTLLGISDTEVLGIVSDNITDGWCTTHDVRVALGEDVESPARSGVGSRLSWLRRYGWLEQGDMHTYDDGTKSRAWRLTEMGESLLRNPRLTSALERTLSGLTPAQRLTLTREMAEFGADGPDWFSHALRRQWRRTLGR